jgi:ribosomal-protein-alanine N-acetyltransferase
MRIGHKLLKIVYNRLSIIRRCFRAVRTMFSTTLAISPYERRHRDAVLDLAYDHLQVQTHLDWYALDDWLDAEAGMTLLAWQGRRLMGVMGFSAPLDGGVWMRLVARRDGAQTREVLRALWDDARVTLAAAGVASVWLTLTGDWLGAHVDLFGMTQVEMIVTLRRAGGDLPRPRNPRVLLRPAEADDVPTMAAIDSAAFGPPWRMTTPDVRAALRIAASCKLAWLDRQVVGYQLSTRYDDAGHLARLAVLPEAQGLGVGGALLDDLIRGFNTRRVRSLTVNTQLSNLRSQRLYSAYGFRRNGHDLPVWTVGL